MKSQHLNTVIDAIDSFSASDSPEKRWATANHLMEELGANALTLGAIQNGAALWTVSSMTKAWLDEYIAKELYLIDPFVSHMQTSNVPIALSTDVTADDQPLNRGLRNAGYAFLYGMPFNGSLQGERRIVTYCSDLSEDEIDRRAYLPQIRAVAPIIITQFSTQDLPDEMRHLHSGELGSREQQVLQFLALGLRNERIAERMGISEVTVRKHFQSGRKKLGAATREQALAIALQRGLIDL